MSAFLHNVTTAFGDADLVGEFLMRPVKMCVNGYQRVFSVLDSSQGMGQRVGEVFTRSLMFLGATLAAIPSTALASIGAVSKLAHLYVKFDEKVSPSSEISEYIPPILKPFSRTGDRVAAYLRARIVADDAGMPLSYKPFKGSEIFAFDQLEKNRRPKYYRSVVHLNTPEQVQALKGADKTQSILYLVPFAPFTREIEREGAGCSYPKYQPDWNQHRARLIQLLKIESEKLVLPDDAYTIALHIRDGGSVDDNNTKTLHPLKLPSLNFYIGELNRVLEMKKQEGQNKFFIHIFTDALNPDKVLDQVRSQVQVEDVEVVFSFTPRDRSTLRYDAGNMGQFQCMIRADSNLSGPIVAASDTQIDIYPSGFDVRNGKLLISEVTQQQRGAEKTRQSTSYSKPMEGWLPNCFNRYFYRNFGVHQVPLKNK